MREQEKSKEMSHLNLENKNVKRRSEVITSTEQEQPIEKLGLKEYEHKNPRSI